jgi:hypothetical protein
MSSTNRGESSSEVWETPWWAVRRLLEELYLPVGRWLEPCAGNGRIIQAVEEDRPGQIIWTAVESRVECKANLVQLAGQVACPEDFLNWDARQAARIAGADVTQERYFDVAITNPPFTKTMEVLSKLLVIADHVLILQKNTWLGGGANNGKNDFLRSSPPDMLSLPDRIRFLQNGVFPRYPADYAKVKLRGRQMPGDSIEYSWYYFPPVPLRFRDYGLRQNLLTTDVEERTSLELLPYPGYIEV